MPPPTDYRPSPNEGPLVQGEIIFNLVEPRIITPWDGELPNSDEGALPGKNFVHPAVVVVSPECDLVSDHAERGKPPQEQRPSQLLPQIQLCQLFLESELRELPKTHPDFNSMHKRVWGNVKTLQHPRWHYLEPGVIQGDPPVEIKAYAADFQSIWGMDPNTIYAALRLDDVNRVAIIDDPFRRSLMHRLAYWQSRVELPDAGDA